METGFSNQENRTAASIGSFIFHAIILAILFFYTFPLIQKDELGGGGIEVALGMPDQGSPDQPDIPKGKQLEDPSATEEIEEMPVKQSKPEPTPPQPEPDPKPSKPSKVEAPKSNSPTTDDPEVAALKKKQQDEKRRKEAENLEQQRQKNETDRKTREETDRKKRDADAAAAASAEAARKKKEAKDKFGSDFGSGTGSGSGTKPGQGGKTDGKVGGDPFGDGGTGGGTGGGAGTGNGASVGGGLSGRKALSRPLPDNNFSKTGKVVVKVCVDADGNVTSADFTQAGSTTSDSQLRSKAEDAAKRWRFAKSDFDKQCGTIAFNFSAK